MRKAEYYSLVKDQSVKVYVEPHVLKNIGIDADISGYEGVITGFYPSGWVQIKVMGELYDILPKYLLVK